MYPVQSIDPPRSSYLFYSDWPCRELVEKSGFHRWTRLQSFREHVKERLGQALGDDLCRDGVYDTFQQLEVLVGCPLESLPIAHAHVGREVEAVFGEGAFGVLVVPAMPQLIRTNAVYVEFTYVVCS